MRKEFPGYFKLTEAETAHIWQTGLVVFDTNALLNLYRYTEKTREDLLAALKSLGDRIRIPYQVGAEFMQTRFTVISEQRKAYSELLAAVETAKKEIVKAINKHDRRHVLLNASELKKSLTEGLEPLTNDVSQLQSQHPDLLIGDDFILSRLADLLDGHMMPARPKKEHETDRKWALNRIAEKIPPGFMDRKKEDGGVGDVLIWKEIIDLAANEKKPIIFVSDEQKEDWIQEIEGKKLGPLPALRQELFDLTGQSFQMYTVERFLGFVKKASDQTVSDASIAEAKTVRHQMNTEDLLSLRDSTSYDLELAFDFSDIDEDPLRVNKLRTLTTPNVNAETRLLKDEYDRTNVELRYLEAQSEQLMRSLSKGSNDVERVLEEDAAYQGILRQMKRLEGKRAFIGRSLFRRLTSKT